MSGDGNWGQEAAQIATESIAMRQACGQARKAIWQERVRSRSVGHRPSCYVGRAWTKGKGMNSDADPGSWLPPAEGWPRAAEIQQSSGRNKATPSLLGRISFIKTPLRGLTHNREKLQMPTSVNVYGSWLYRGLVLPFISVTCSSKKAPFIPI